MAIILEKKKPIELGKAKVGMKKLTVGLGWSEKPINGLKLDCDVSVFMLGENGKLPQDQFFVFYNNLKSPDGSVIHLGDSRGGEGEGDDESITIELDKIDSKIEFIYFTVTIHESETRRHHFGNVEEAYINIYNDIDPEPVCTYELNEAFDGQDSLLIATLSRNGNNWKIEAIGQPFSGGLATLVELYQ